MTRAAARPLTRYSELSYASPHQRRLTRWVIRAVEATAGRRRYARLYGIWRHEIVPTGERIFGRVLGLVGIRLQPRGAWPPMLPASPLVLVANHPFGIGDGIVMLALAEAIGRPFRVLIHSDLLRVPEMRAYALPIDFSETKAAAARNIATRREAVDLLKAGVTIVIFPAGGVATAPAGFGRAQDLPWKMFVARLIGDAGACVLPVHFQGQNSRAFHLVSWPMRWAGSDGAFARALARGALTMRLALLVREFAGLRKRPIRFTVGPVIPWAELAPIRDRKQLLGRLREAVANLAPETEREPGRLAASLGPIAARASAPFAMLRRRRDARRMQRSHTA